MKIQPLPDPREERELAQQLNQALRPLDETPPPLWLPIKSPPGWKRKPPA